MPSEDLARTFFPTPGPYQLAYVTSDLGHALGLYRARFGIPQFARINDFKLTVGTDRAALINVAMAFVGDVQLELIEPCGGDDQLFRDPLPLSGFASRIHHLGYLVPSPEHWRLLLDEIRRQGLQTPVRCSFPNAEIIYTDRRQDLGHCIEYFLFSDAGRAWQATIPRYA